jgi:hypothetical protein
MTEMAFGFLPLSYNRATAGPRTTSLTMVMDMGFGLATLRDQ